MSGAPCHFCNETLRNVNHVLTECRELSVPKGMYLQKEYPTLGDNRVAKGLFIFLKTMHVYNDV